MKRLIVMAPHGLEQHYNSIPSCSKAAGTISSTEENKMKIKRVLAFWMVLTVLLSSCSSIYDSPLYHSEVTYELNVDTSLEYYTTGNVYTQGDVKSGLLYEGCLIFIEQQPTIAQIGEKGEDKIPVYGESVIKRIVKYNPTTGVTSSPCLNPNCNHSFESGCPLLLPNIIGSHTITIKGIFGDWLVLRIKQSDDKYRTLNEETMYNLKTGEVRKIYNEDLATEVMTRWQGGAYYNGKYYRIKLVLDYSDTQYNPSESSSSIKDYVPETKSVFCEYDFETDKTKELFEIPLDYNISKITNERFYFGCIDGTKVMLSYKKDGSDKREEPSHELNSTNLIGTYTYDYTEEGFLVHDLISGIITPVTYDFTLPHSCCLTENGVLADSQTAYDEWKAFSIKEYKKQNPNATNQELNTVAKKILGAGTAQIWRCGFKGEDPHVIFELENAFIKTIAAQSNNVFCTVEHYNTETGKVTYNPNGKLCVINIKTGEIIDIPFLDVVVPSHYVN